MVVGGHRPRVLLALLFVALLALASWQIGSAGAETDWEVEPVGSPGSGDGQLYEPSDVALAPGGDLYVADRGNFRVQRFSAAGTYVGKWGTAGAGQGQFGDLIAVAVSPGGQVYALADPDAGGYYLQRFSASGTFELGWGTVEGSALGQFDDPTDIAIGTDGDVYVTEAGNQRVQVFAADGSSPSSFGSAGLDGEGELANPISVAVSPASGDVYVADAGGTSRIQHFSAGGDFISQWGSTGNEAGQFRSGGLNEVVVDPQGAVYTRERFIEGSRFQCFSSTGEFIGEFTWSNGDQSVDLGLAVSDTSLYAPDTDRGVVLRYGLAQPSASLLAPYTPIEAGRAFKFQVTNSVPLGRVVRFEWDFDSDGVYEVPNGNAEAVYAYPSPGTYEATVRVTSDRGGVGTDTRLVQVTPAEGETGSGGDGSNGDGSNGNGSVPWSWEGSGSVSWVSINGGAQFTDDPDVTVSVQPPLGAGGILISNDGGLAGASQRPVAQTVPWTLESSGSERLPKTIYVRFQGGASDNTVYQDDIILDQTAPRLSSARIESTATGSRLRARAADGVSGVAAMQLSSPRGRRSWRRYRSKLRISGQAEGLSIRVRDAAGNVSRWKRVATP